MFDLKWVIMEDRHVLFYLVSQKETEQKSNRNKILACFIWKNTLKLLIKLAQQHPRNNGKHIKRTITWNANIHPQDIRISKSHHKHYSIKSVIKIFFCQIMLKTNIEI